MIKPTKLEDMSEAKQAEILLAWFHDRPLQCLENWGWADRENTAHPPLRNVAYRIKPEPKSGTVYLNVYSDTSIVINQDREHADKNAAPSRLACIRVEWVEGQFDE